MDAGISAKALVRPQDGLHSVFGGSSAPRIVACPASLQLSEQVPADLRRASSSSDADRGTALHAVMSQALIEEREPEEFARKIIEGYKVSDDDVACALRPAIDYAN